MKGHWIVNLFMYTIQDILQNDVWSIKLFPYVFTSKTICDIPQRIERTWIELTNLNVVEVRDCIIVETLNSHNSSKCEISRMETTQVNEQRNGL